MSNLKSVLEDLKSKSISIKLKLYPAIGNTIITKENNRLIINDGEYGEYEGVSEQEYDLLYLEYSK